MKFVVRNVAEVKVDVMKFVVQSVAEDRHAMKYVVRNVAEGRHTHGCNLVSTTLQT